MSYVCQLLINEDGDDDDIVSQKYQSQKVSRIRTGYGQWRRTYYH